MILLHEWSRFLVNRFGGRKWERDWSTSFFSLPDTCLLCKTGFSHHSHYIICACTDSPLEPSRKWISGGKKLMQAHWAQASIKGWKGCWLRTGLPHLSSTLSTINAFLSQQTEHLRQNLFKYIFLILHIRTETQLYQWFISFCGIKSSGNI